MRNAIPAKRARLIERIVRAAQQSARGGRLTVSAETFLRAYFRGVSEEDLGARDPAYLAAAALTHLAFGRERTAGRMLVKIFSPSPEDAGLASPHTLVFVVAPDMPFLLDSLGIVFSQAGVGVHLIVHPVLTVTRSRRGTLRSARLAGNAAPAGAGRPESWQLLEIDRQLDPDRIEQLARRLRSTLFDVRDAAADWVAMRARIQELARRLTRSPAPAREAREARALLEWMCADHFTFLGYRRYRLRRGRGKDQLLADRRSGLGILRVPRRGTPAPSPTSLRGEIRRRARTLHPLIVTKANAVSTVHRATYLDYVGIKSFDRSGRVSGEHRFLGLWTASVYEASPQDIPVLREKAAEVMRRFGLAADSHDAKAVQHALETFPRDELFQASASEVMHIVRGIVNLYERALVRVFVRRDPFERFYSCFVYIPRDRYSTSVRERVESILSSAFDGHRVEAQVQLSESTLARLHVVVRTVPHEPGARRARPRRCEIDVASLEHTISEAIASWSDRLRAELASCLDESAALAATRRYTAMLPATYTDDVAPSAALADLSEIDALEREPTELRLRWVLPPPGSSARARLKLMKVGDPVPISELLPILENFGLRLIAERPYPLAWPAGGSAWIQDLELEHPGTRGDLERAEPRFLEGFLAAWHGEIESDGFNRLLLTADLRVREIAVLRAYCRYLLQAGLPFSQAYMERVLAQNSPIARRLFRLFELQLDPQHARGAALPRTAASASRRAERQAATIRRALDAVQSLDEDRILRAYLEAIAATLRTNFFQCEPSGRPKGYIALKLDPRRLPFLPLPRPRFEIFVHSARVEAVHLRMASIARGGIRWSDRREDFRTEVLGLMKAQNVKNAVIVPMGAKGGFVVKRPPSGGAAELQREVVACYQTFMRGLLDLTDNLVARKAVSPPGVVCRDGPDVYLVVAADKGTAAFSDIANRLAREYGYWLGDAFASGGSAGFDHKRMGITARGAWECAKRHFRELDLDVERSDFSVAGIGDMSGDVFGNGMLLSRHILLKAAFNHQHIFLDPAPDARRSFAERARLFALPRSSWDDYDRHRISRGGGVYPRSAKSVALSREAQSLLALPPGPVTTQDIIRAILKMPIDLLWNGGIGTYVKATSESHLEVGDRANDAVRVNGEEVRARVVVEGGNLGFSQRGRIEYAQAGGRLNTDFIDNSAGVNTSDVEVNIKILLDRELEAGRLRPADRRRWLAGMTGDVAELVLRNNYLQSQALSTLEQQSVARLPEYRHLIRLLERCADLNRALEFLPDEEALEERRQHGLGLTRPELSVVLAYSKIWLSHHLIVSDVPEDPYWSDELERYFPALLRRRFAPAIAHHPLRREIVATATANSLVNRMGPAFVLRAQEDTGAAPERIARAYTVAREMFDMRRLWTAIEALDNRIPARVQYSMMFETSRLLRHTTYRLLTSRRSLKIDDTVAELRSGVRELKTYIASRLAGLARDRFESARRASVEAGVPTEIGARVASLDALNGALDIVEIAGARTSVRDAAQAYFELGARLGIDWLHEQVEHLPVEGAWQAIARGELRHGFERAHRRIVERALAVRASGAPLSRVCAWLALAREKIDHWQRRVADMRTAGAADFATLSVALESVRRLAD